jgi:hypothetical protein
MSTRKEPIKVPTASFALPNRHRRCGWTRFDRHVVILVAILTMTTAVAHGASPIPTIPDARRASAIWEGEINAFCNQSGCESVYTNELSHRISCSKQRGWDKCLAPHCEREEVERENKWYRDGWCRKEPQKFGEATNEGESVDVLRVWFHRNICDLGLHCFKMIDVEKVGQKVIKIADAAPEQPSTPLPEPGNPTGS